jgi:serine/threonine protein kinase
MKKNFNVIQKSPSKFQLGSSEYRIVKELKDGKSGDTVLLIKKDNTKYVLKIFNSGKEKHEINNHLYFNSLFNYPVAPKIYFYGKLKGFFNGPYYLMEYTGNYSLDDYVRKYCKINKNILLQLLYIISTMKKANLYHCDLQLTNIMLQKNTRPQKFNFSHLDPTLTKNYTIGKYMVKIIDFGLSSRKECPKKRKITASMIKLALKCGKPQLALLFLNNPTNDLTNVHFFMTTLKILGIPLQTQSNNNIFTQLYNTLK